MDNQPETSNLDWEEQLASLLGDLTETQTDLLAVLDKKRKALVAGDSESLEPIQTEEQTLSGRLEACLQRRQSMLRQAADQGLPSDDLRSLAEALPTESRTRLRPAIRDGRARARLIQHQSLTNWVLVQRTLLHLSQMIEIIATGGEKSPTYERSGPSPVGGALVDCDA